MKKLLSVFLAVLMIFSVMTVAFAADGDAEETPAASETTDAQDEGTDSTGGLLDTIKDFPVGGAKALLKVGKIVLKLVKVFVKVGIKLGFIDSEDLIQQVADIFGLNAETEQPVDATEPAAPAAA